MDMSGKYTIEIPQVKKVAVAYSGGLDSALALKLLPEYYGAEEVLAVTVNVGLMDEEIQEAKMKAEAADTPWFFIEATDEFVDDYITKAIYAFSLRVADGPYVASAMGLLGMVLLAASLLLAGRFLGRRMGELFRA